MAARVRAERMSLDFDATDTRTRRFRNAGNSCYINATLQALFAVPPVQRLYEKADLSRLLPGGDIRDDERIDGDICIANVYREARLATRKLQPMYPQIFLDRFYHEMQEDANHFSKCFLTAIFASLRVYWNSSKAKIDRLANAVHARNHDS